jgi:hypothetical protein
MNNILFHSMNKITTYVDVEYGDFISLPKDETDKPPVNADINGLQFFGKSTQDGEPTAENPVDTVCIPPEFDLTVCGRNLWDEEWEAGTLYSDGTLDNTEAAKEHCIRSKNYITVIPSTEYFQGIPARTRLNIAQYDANKEYIDGTVTYHIGSRTFSTHEQCRYIRIGTYKGETTQYDYYGNVYNNNICINVSDANFNGNYAAYRGNIYSYRLEDLDGNLYELCSLPDGTRDEYDVDNGVLIKRVKKLIVTSGTTSEPINLQAHYWTMGADSAYFNIYWSDTTNGWQSELGGSYNVRCNIANPRGGEFGCSLNLRTSETTLEIRCPKDWFISWGYTLDNDGVRQYINDIIADTGEPITFLYPYSEPQVIPIKQYGKTYNGQVWLYNQKPKSIQYHTNIFTDVGVEMQCEVRKLGNKPMGYYYWTTENGDRIVNENGDYIMLIC